MTTGGDEWLSRAPTRLALPHVLAMSAFDCLTAVDGVIGHLLSLLPKRGEACDTDSDARPGAIPEDGADEMCAALRGQALTLFGSAVISLGAVTQDASQELNAVVEEYVDDTVGEKGDCIYDVVRGPDVWRINRTTWHGVFLALAGETFHRILHDLGVNPRSLGKKPSKSARLAWVIKRGRLDAEDVAATCRAREAELPDLLSQMPIPSIADRMMLKNRMECELLRALRRRNPDGIPREETLGFEAERRLRGVPPIHRCESSTYQCDQVWVNWKPGEGLIRLPPGEPRLTVTLDPPQAILDGNPYALNPDGAFFVNALLKASGDWVTGKAIAEKLPMRPDRAKGKLPKPIQSLIESSTGKGYRIPRDKLA